MAMTLQQKQAAMAKARAARAKKIKEREEAETPRIPELVVPEPEAPAEPIQDAMDRANEEGRREDRDRIRKMKDRAFLEAAGVSKGVPKDRSPKDLTFAELYDAIYDAGENYESIPEWAEFRRRILRWPRRRLLKAGAFVPDKRWRPI